MRVDIADFSVNIASKRYMMSLVSLVAAVAVAGATPDPYLEELRPTLRGACTVPDTGASDNEARTQVWDARLKASPLCLYLLAPVFREADPERGMRLFLLGMVRDRYEQSLCVERPGPADTEGLFTARVLAGEAMKDAMAPLMASKGREVAIELLGAADVLDYEPSELETLCANSGGVKPRAEWPAVAQQVLEQARPKAP